MCGDVTDFGYLISAEDNAVVPCAYIAFQVSTTWLVLAIFTAEVVDTTISTSNTMDKEELAMAALHSRSLQRDSFTVALRKLFDESVGEGMKEIDLDTLKAFLEDEDNVAVLEGQLNMSAYMAINAWEAIETNGSAHMDDYIDGLVLASHQSQEHSILRCWAQSRRLHRDHHQMWDDLTPPKPEPLAYEEVNPGPSTGATSQWTQHSGIKGVWSEVSQLRSEFAQLHGSVQALTEDISAIRRQAQVNSKDSDEKSKAEVRKAQRDVSELTVEVQGTQLGLGEVRNEVEALREQFRQSSQAEDIRSEFRSLREKLDNVACTEDLGGVSHALTGVAQALSGMRSDENDVRSSLVNVQGEVTALRSEVSELVKTIRGDREGGRSTTTSPSKRLEQQQLQERRVSRDSSGGLESGGSDQKPFEKLSGLDRLSALLQKPPTPSGGSLESAAGRVERSRSSSSVETKAQKGEDASSPVQRPKEQQDYRAVFNTAPAALLASESDEQSVHGFVTTPLPERTGMETTYQPLASDRIIRRDTQG
jgi:uncharacterized coiled-coil DUF342 family protein